MLENGISGSLITESGSQQEEIATLRQRQAEMASSLASAHLRIAELTSENVNCYKREKILSEKIALLTEELNLRRQQVWPASLLLRLYLKDL